MKISASSIASFKRCRQLWYYKHVLGLSPLAEPIEYTLGTAVHAGLAAYYTGGNPTTAFMRSWREHEHVLPFPSIQEDSERMKLYVTGMGMLDTYVEWATRNDTFIVLLSEYEFSLPIPGTLDGVFAGRIDGLAEDEWGDLWIIEFKTTDSFYPDGHLDLNEQTSLYQWTMQRVIASGILAEMIHPSRQVVGTIFTQLRKAVPQKPPLLKSGAVSKNMTVSTTYDLYYDTILEYGLNPDDYQEHLYKLLQQGDTFIRRETCVRTETELAQVERNLVAVHEDMAFAKEHGIIYPSWDKWCPRYCAFYQPCVNRQKGDDEEYTLRTQFMRKEQPTADTSAVEEEIVL